MKCLALIFVGLLGTAVAGSAQSPTGTSWPPPVGARVRIVSPVLGLERQVGTIESVTGDTLRFRRADGVGPVSLKPSEITTIEVSAGTHTAKAKWAGIGSLAGAVAGGVIGAATYTPCSCIGDIFGRGGSIGIGVILGALTGGIGGALWGTRRQETWAAVAR